MNGQSFERLHARCFPLQGSEPAIFRGLFRWTSGRSSSEHDCLLQSAVAWLILQRGECYVTYAVDTSVLAQFARSGMGDIGAQRPIDAVLRTYRHVLQISEWQLTFHCGHPDDFFFLLTCRSSSLLDVLATSLQKSRGSVIAKV